MEVGEIVEVDEDVGRVVIIARVDVGDGWVVGCAVGVGVGIGDAIPKARSEYASPVGLTV